YIASVSLMVGDRSGQLAAGSHDCVGVGTAETERVYSRELLSRLWKQQGLRTDVEIERLKFDVRVWFAKMQRRRQDPVVKGKHCLEQARQARSRLKMADIRLDGPDRERRRPLLAQASTDCRRLDWIADWRASPVRFNERESTRVDAVA